MIGYFVVIVACLAMGIVGQELVQGASLFRHGSRYHLFDVYDGAATRNLWGEITPVGMRQHYNLGQLMRQLYIDQQKFLQPSYNHSQLEVFATTVPRAIDSGTSHLMGLYPDGTGPSLPKGLAENLLVPPYKYSDDAGGQQALPYGRQVIPIKEGGLMTECDNLGKEQDKNLAEEHATVDEMNSRYQPFLARVAQIFNFTQPINIVNMSDLYDTVTVDRFLGRPVPAALTEDDYLNFQHLQYFTYLLKFTRNLSKAITTPKLERILTTFDARIKNASALLKWSMMCGHDTQIYPMLNLLNISSSSCIEQLWRFGKTTALNCHPGPQYAASLVFQLHRSTDNSYNVMVRYNGQYVYLCEKKQTTCPYNEFKTRVQKNFIDPASVCTRPATIANLQSES